MNYQFMNILYHYLSKKPNFKQKETRFKECTRVYWNLEKKQENHYIYHTKKYHIHDSTIGNNNANIENYMQQERVSGNLGFNGVKIIDM